MEGVEFDLDPNQGARDFSRHVSAVKTRPSFLIGLLAKMGIADPVVSNFILAGIAAIFFGISIFLYAGIIEKDAASKLSYTEVAAQLKVLEQMQNRNNK